MKRFFVLSVFLAMVGCHSIERPVPMLKIRFMVAVDPFSIIHHTRIIRLVASFFIWGLSICLLVLSSTLHFYPIPFPIIISIASRSLSIQ